MSIYSTSVKRPVTTILIFVALIVIGLYSLTQLPIDLYPEIELSNRNEMLKPGMFVRVSMDLGEVETFVVPAATVLLQEGTNIRYVFIEDQGIARRIEVLIGKRFDDQLEIISDNLKEGSKLITEGQSRLLNEDKVEIAE